MEPIQLDDSPMIKSQSSDYICRICFEGESEEHKLIIPCKCSGSMRYIHEDCLKIWLLSSDKDLSASECDICKSLFQMKIQLATKCTCKNYWNECLGMFIFPILILLMSSIFMVILLFLVQSAENNTSSTGEITYLSLLLLACAIIITIITIIFVKTLKKGCCSSEMVHWTIESIAQDPTLEETLEHPISNQTLQNDEVQVMVMPKFLKLKGRNIIRPDIVTPSLMPIMRSGELVAYRSKPATTRSLGASQSLGSNPNLAKTDNNFINSKIVPEP